MAVCGLFGYFGNVEIAVENERKRTRNGRRAHYEYVWDSAFGDERASLLYPETVLFVAHARRKIIKFHVALNDRVRAYHDFRFAALYLFLDFGLLFTLGRTA